MPNCIKGLKMSSIVCHAKTSYPFDMGLDIVFSLSIMNTYQYCNVPLILASRFSLLLANQKVRHLRVATKYQPLPILAFCASYE